VFPKELPISGNLEGPKIINAMTRIRIRPGMPMLDNKRLTSSYPDGLLVLKK
jgi:hypothetical protein